jgi:HSP20 family molecular chaperone IbpA
VSIDDLENEVLRVFNDACSARAQRPVTHRGYCPPADVYFESDSGQIIVRFEIPGLDRDEINLLVDRRQIVVRGERRFPRASTRSYQQVELDYGPFERRLRLAVDINPDNTAATYDNGILEVRLALAQREHEVSQIPIRSERDER